MRKTILLLTILLFFQGAYAIDYLSASDSRVTDALNYLSSIQSNDGGFGDQSTTCWAITAIASAGGNPDSYVKTGNTPVSYLRSTAISEPLNPPNGYSRTILALVAAGHDPTNFTNQNLVAALKSYDPDLDGNYGNIQANIWAILALASVGETGAAMKTADYLLATENAQGCWGTESNTCAAAIQALRAVGISNSQLSNAKTKLRSYQLGDAGFMECATCPGGAVSDANSDSWALQAFAALGESIDTWKVGENDTLAHLLSLQNPGGSFNWSSSEEKTLSMNTYQAIPAVLGKQNPIATKYPDLATEVQFFSAPDRNNITLKAVKNLQNISATNATINVTIDGISTIIEQAIGPLSGFIYETQLSAGTHTYSILLDQHGNYTETDETNNQASGSISTENATVIISTGLGNETIVEHRNRAIPQNAKAYEAFAGLADVTYTVHSFGVSIDTINGMTNTWVMPYNYWGFFQNGFKSAVGVHNTVSDGDEIQIDYYTHGWGILDLYWNITIVYPVGDSTLQAKAESLKTTLEGAGVAVNVRTNETITNDEKSNWLVLLGYTSQNSIFGELNSQYSLGAIPSPSQNQGIINQIRNPRTAHINYVTLVTGNDELGLLAATDKAISASSSIQAYPTTYADAVDLTSGITMSNDNPTDGDSVTFYLNISNAGSLDAANVTLRLLVDGEEKYSTNTTVPQKAQSQSTHSWPSSTGSHTALLTVTYAPNETDSGNNNNTKTFTVNARDTSGGGGGGSSGTFIIPTKKEDKDKGETKEDKEDNDEEKEKKGKEEKSKDSSSMKEEEKVNETDTSAQANETDEQKIPEEILEIMEPAPTGLAVITSGISTGASKITSAIGSAISSLFAKIFGIFK